ncbi:MAG: RNA pseudouridine synthase [Piscirickettsiaceae bacterium]|nr:RNA pseudouridine synthase [Piscirickettsiaceae bacterium]
MSDIPPRFEKHIEVTKSGAVAVDLIAMETGLSKQVIKKVMQKGAVWLSKGKRTQRLRRAKKALKQGEVIHLYYDQNVLAMIPPEPTLIVDEGKYSIWNKPYGLLSQGSKWGDHCTITRWAEQNLKPQRVSFVVHRLDRAANGLIIVAHEKNSAAALSKLFQDRKVEKRYQIWVHGQFDEKADKDNPTRVNTDIDGRSAVSYFSVIKYDAKQNRSLLDVNIETGRKHQIRRHAAELGFPVIGDRLHGQEGDKEDLQLTAYYLSFICPYTHKKNVFNLLS